MYTCNDKTFADVLQGFGHEAKLARNPACVLQNPVGEWQESLVRQSAVIDVHNNRSLLFGQRQGSCGRQAV